MPAPAMTTSKCSVGPVDAGRIWVWTFIGSISSAEVSASSPVRSHSLHFPAAQECQPLEQMHVLLVFQERAVQRRDQLARIALPQHLGRDVFVQQQLEPVQKLRGRGLLLQPRYFPNLEEDPQGLF